MQIPNQKVQWQQLGAFSHVGMIKTKFKLSVIMSEKIHLSDFERGIIVGVSQAGLSISERLGFSHTTERESHLLA